MEFVHESEVADLIRNHHLTRVSDAEGQVHLEMQEPAPGGPEGGVVRLHLSCPESRTPVRDGATVVHFQKSRLPKVVEHIIHLLHLDEVVLIPVGRWRSVFDAVAFSLAGNEQWQEMDAIATIELNTRDPLVCDPTDVHTLIALIEALLSDAERPEQGLMIVPTAAPVLLEIVPDGAIRVSLGSAVLVDELEDVLAG